MSRNVFVNSGSLKFVQTVSVCPHVFQADEASEIGLLRLHMGLCSGSECPFLP